MCLGNPWIFSKINGIENHHVFSLQTCKKENCGVVSFEDRKFLITFILSICSASFGITRFLKNGPMTLLPRNHYSPSFLLAILCTATTLIAKGSFLSKALADSASGKIWHTQTESILIWFTCLLLPHFFYVSSILGSIHILRRQIFR